MQGYRTPLFGQMPPVVKNLLIVNVIAFLLASFINYEKAVEYFGMFYPASELFRPHQIVTHMFMHGNISHLFFNMFALFMFGRMLEVVWGSKRLLTYYMITGLGAVLLHIFVTWIDITQMRSVAALFIESPSPELFDKFARSNINNPSQGLLGFISQYYSNPDNPYIIQQAQQLCQTIIEHRMDVPVIGASGAVFGVLLAFGMLFPNTELMLLFPPIPIKAKWFVIGYGVIELWLGVANRSGDNVAHFAHLGGMIFGFILIKYWNRKK